MAEPGGGEPNLATWRRYDHRLMPHSAARTAAMPPKYTIAARVPSSRAMGSGGARSAFPALGDPHDDEADGEDHGERSEGGQVVKLAEDHPVEIDGRPGEGRQEDEHEG